MGAAYDFVFEFFNTLLSDFQQSDSFARVILLPIFFSGFGAFSGGLIAFRFRRREEGYKRKKDRLERAAKVVGLASGMCGSAISMKRQLIMPTAKLYFEGRDRVLSVLGIPTVQKTIFLKFDLMTFSPPAMSAKEVLDAVVELGYGDARNLSQAIALLKSSNNLASLCDSRNDWIEGFQKASNEMSETRKMLTYYGMEDENGTKDQRYLHIIQGLVEAVDNVLFHSFEIYSRTAVTLVDDADAFQRRYGEKYSFAFTDFSEQVARGIFPSRAEYEDWLREPTAYKRKFGESRRAFLDKKKMAIKSNYSA